MLNVKGVKGALGSWKTPSEQQLTYNSNVILNGPRYSHRMLRILLRNDCEITNLIP